MRSFTLLPCTHAHTRAFCSFTLFECTHVRAGSLCSHVVIRVLARMRMRVRPARSDGLLCVMLHVFYINPMRLNNAGAPSRRMHVFTHSSSANKKAAPMKDMGAKRLSSKRVKTCKQYEAMCIGHDIGLMDILYHAVPHCMYHTAWNVAYCTTLHVPYRTIVCHDTHYTITHIVS